METGVDTGDAGSSAPTAANAGDLDVEAWFDRVKCAKAGDVSAALGRLGEYELLGIAGRGGQGIVYRARQPRTGREVALKRLGAGAFSTREMQARFEREIHAASTLDHPGIVTVYGTEVIDAQPVLSMQWVQGVPID